MTTLAFNQAIYFRENLRNGENLLEKAGKLLARINSALLEATRRELVEKEVDLQFDKVMCSVNAQLKRAEEGTLIALEELERFNSALIDDINNDEEGLSECWSDIVPLCSILTTATTLVLTQIKSSRRNLAAAGIDRVCVGECDDILKRLEKNFEDTCFLLEELSTNAEIRDALLEQPLVESSNPELNALLG